VIQLGDVDLKPKFVIIMSCNKEGNFELQTSLWGDFRQGELAMKVDAPWHCNYSPISNKRKQIGGRSLMDEVNHVNTVVSGYLVLCTFMLCMFNLFMVMLVWMHYKGLLNGKVTKLIFAEA